MAVGILVVGISWYVYTPGSTLEASRVKTNSDSIFYNLAIESDTSKKRLHDGANN